MPTDLLWPQQPTAAACIEKERVHCRRDRHRGGNLHIASDAFPTGDLKIRFHTGVLHNHTNIDTLAYRMSEEADWVQAALLRYQYQMPQASQHLAQMHP